MADILHVAYAEMIDPYLRTRADDRIDKLEDRLRAVETSLTAEEIPLKTPSDASLVADASRKTKPH